MTEPIDARSGTALAAAAAVAFGVTTPIVAAAGQGAGAFATAALLYLGAALASLLFGARPERPPRGGALVLGAMVLAGAVIAPAAYAWGLGRTGATAGSLLLNLEAVFTVACAGLVLRERASGRVVLALSLMAAGGVALVVDRMEAAPPAGALSIDGAGPLGALAVALATLAWAMDNVLARKLEPMTPTSVVLLKGALGGVTSAFVALALGQAWPPVPRAAALLGAGAIGYGASLRLYLSAQRRMGAGRTGSVFALAPFVGAALGFLLGDRGLGPLAVLALALFGVGVALHATERTPE